MNLFPTQYSTLSATALGDHIQNKYGFKNLVCRLLVRNVSDTYILERITGKEVGKESSTDKLTSMMNS